MTKWQNLVTHHNFRPWPALIELSSGHQKIAISLFLVWDFFLAVDLLYCLWFWFFSTTYYFLFLLVIIAIYCLWIFASPYEFWFFSLPIDLLFYQHISVCFLIHMVHIYDLWDWVFAYRVQLFSSSTHKIDSSLLSMEFVLTMEFVSFILLMDLPYSLQDLVLLCCMLD